MKRNPFTADHKLVNALSQRSDPVTCSEDRVLFCQGEPASGLYILRFGAAILTLKSEAGRTAMCFQAHASSLLGLPAIIGNEPYTLTAIAQKGSVVRYVAREEFEDLIRVEPSLLVMVSQVVAAEVIAAREAIAEY